MQCHGHLTTTIPFETFDCQTLNPQFKKINVKCLNFYHSLYSNVIRWMFEYFLAYHLLDQ